MHIANPKGKWYVNTGNYRFVDPESGTAFDPGEPTKATETEWLKLQADVIKPTDDPMAEEPEKASEKPPAK